MVGPWFYAGSFILILVVLPPMLASASVADPTAANLILVSTGVVNLILLVFVWKRCSLPGLSFWDSLRVISGRSMSGCANITILYIYPLLFFCYIIAAYHTFIGLFRGPDYTSEHWLRFVVPNAVPQTRGSGVAQGSKKCPYCAETILADAIFCRYCGHDTRTPDAVGRMMELNSAHDIPTDRAKSREWDRKHGQQQASPAANQAPDWPSPGVASSPSPAKPPPPPPTPRSAAPPAGSGPNPTVVVLVALGLILVWVFAMILGGPQSTASPTHPAPSPTHRGFPTNTPRPAARVPIRASPTPSCTPWWEITLADVGARICVYGDVYLAYGDGQAYFVTFSSSEDAFYVLSYDVSFPNLRPGDCFRAVGEIDHLGNTPVMVVGWASEVTDCH